MNVIGGGSGCWGSIGGGGGLLIAQVAAQRLSLVRALAHLGVLGRLAAGQRAGRAALRRALGPYQYERAL